MRTTLSACGARSLVTFGVLGPRTAEQIGQPARIRFHHRAVERDALRDELRAALRAARGRRTSTCRSCSARRIPATTCASAIPAAACRAGGADRPQIIKSDFLLVQLGGDGEGWMPFRDAYEVKGRKLRERDDRLLKLFTSNDKERFEKAAKLQRRQQQAQSRQRRAHHQHSDAGDDVPAPARQRALRIHRRRRGEHRRPHPAARRSTRKWRGRR